MKKFHIIGLTLFAAIVLGAFSASSAFAVSQWLVEGKTLAAPVAAETEGLLELVKYTEANSLVILTIIHCEGIFDGTIGLVGKDEITDLLNLSMEEIGSLEDSETALALECKVTFDAGASTDCKENTIALVWVENLSLELGDTWLTNITLEGTTFDDSLTSNLAGQEPGYEVECESLFLGIKGTETCLGIALATLTNDLTTTPASVLGVFSNPEDGSSLLSTCSMTGVKSAAQIGEGKTWAIGAELERLETSVSDV